MTQTSTIPRTLTPRSAQSIKRILDAAARLFGNEGFEGSSMSSVARAAGVSKGLLHYHFRSKEQLLIEAQRATFQKIHVEFESRFESGERGIETALEGIDALWDAFCGMRAWTPFIVETMSLAGQDRPIRPYVEEFYSESTALLEKGIRNVFEMQLDELALPPQRLAMVIRTALHGLVMELSFARTPLQIERVNQTYRDLRNLFAQVVLNHPSPLEVST